MTHFAPKPIFIQPELHHAAGAIMGGPWQIKHVVVAGVDPQDVVKAALEAFTDVDRKMSTYKADSELMRINVGPLNTWLPLSEELHRVMACADGFARRSEGALNIAIGQLVNTWGFGPCDTPNICPDHAEQRAQAALCALGSYSLRSHPPAVFKLEQISFDLCAVAKGFAVDHAARAVARLGVNDFLIEAAGEVFAKGLRHDMTPWSVGLELPVPDQNIVFDHLILDNMAVATSGGYRNSRLIEGQAYGHTISPKTGNPLESDLLCVTVLHESCMHADALATVLYVLGSQAGPEFAALHNIAALFLIREPDGFREIRSEEFSVKTTQ